MCSSKKPWLNKDGQTKRDDELKKICRTWSAATWEAYLSTLDTPLREQLVPTQELNKVPQSGSYAEVYQALLQQSEYPKFEKAMDAASRVLTATERKVIHFLFWDKLSLQEAATLLGVHKSSVVIYRNRALKKLGNKLIRNEL